MYIYIYIYVFVCIHAYTSLTKLADVACELDHPGSSWGDVRACSTSLATDLGALAGSIGPNRMALIDLAGFVRQKLTEKVA